MAMVQIIEVISVLIEIMNTIGSLNCVTINLWSLQA